MTIPCQQILTQNVSPTIQQIATCISAARQASLLTTSVYVRAPSGLRQEQQGRLWRRGITPDTPLLELFEC